MPVTIIGFFVIEKQWHIIKTFDRRIYMHTKMQFNLSTKRGKTMNNFIKSFFLLLAISMGISVEAGMLFRSRSDNAPNRHFAPSQSRNVEAVGNDGLTDANRQEVDALRNRLAQKNLYDMNMQYAASQLNRNRSLAEKRNIQIKQQVTQRGVVQQRFVDFGGLSGIDIDDLSGVWQMWMADSLSQQGAPSQAGKRNIGYDQGIWNLLVASATQNVVPLSPDGVLLRPQRPRRMIAVLTGDNHTYVEGKAFDVRVFVVGKVIDPRTKREHNLMVNEKLNFFSIVDAYLNSDGVPFLTPEDEQIAVAFAQAAGLENLIRVDNSGDLAFTTVDISGDATVGVIDYSGKTMLECFQSERNVNSILGCLKTTGSEVFLRAGSALRKVVVAVASGLNNNLGGVIANLLGGQAPQNDWDFIPGFDSFLNLGTLLNNSLFRDQSVSQTDLVQMNSFLSQNSASVIVEGGDINRDAEPDSFGELAIPANARAAGAKWTYDPKEGLVRLGKIVLDRENIQRLVYVSTDGKAKKAPVYPSIKFREGEGAGFRKVIGSKKIILR